MTPIERAVAVLGDMNMETDGGSCPMAGWFDREDLDGMVRAVIAAIREPSEDMVGRAVGYDVDIAWPIMIDVLMARPLDHPG